MRSFGGAIPERILQPTALPRSRPPLTLVCGSPGSGKSTFVRHEAAAEDVVIDLAEILRELTSARGARQPATTDQLRRSLEVRNRRLAALATSDAPGAWFIIGAPTSAERARWRAMLGASRVVVLATPLDETRRRIDGDPSRALMRMRHRVLAEQWWAKFTTGAGEELIEMETS